MFRLVFLLLVSPLFFRGQPSAASNKEELTKIYSQAISDYINAVYKKDKTHYDTLFFGKNSEFPNIKLPSEITHTKISVLTQEQADKKLLYKKSLVYINMMGWVEKTNAKFILVTFFVGNGYRPQHNCEIDYNYYSKEKIYKLERLEFKYPYSGK